MSDDFVPAPCFVEEVALKLTVPVQATRGRSTVDLPEGALVQAPATRWAEEVSYLFCWPAEESGAPVHLAWVPRYALREV